MTNRMKCVLCLCLLTFGEVAGALPSGFPDDHRSTMYNSFASEAVSSRTHASGITERALADGRSAGEKPLTADSILASYGIRRRRSNLSRRRSSNTYSSSKSSSGSRSSALKSGPKPSSKSKGLGGTTPTLIRGMPGADKGPYTMKLEVRTKGASHASGGGIHVSLCQAKTSCLDAHELDYLSTGEIETFTFPENKWTSLTPLNFVKIDTTSSNAWFADYMQVDVVDGDGHSVVSEFFELDGWLEGKPMQKWHDDGGGEGHPLWHRSAMTLPKGPKMTITVKTSKRQRTKHAGAIEVYPCQDELTCSIGYVKLRNLEPGATQVFEANIWQDMYSEDDDDGGSEWEPPWATPSLTFPIKKFGGLQFHFVDPVCDDKRKYSDCVREHANDCWFGDEVQVTIENLPGADKSVVPLNGVLCRNGSVPAVATVAAGLEPEFTAGPRVYIPAGALIWVNVTVHQDTGDEDELAGPIFLKICSGADASSCVGNITMDKLRPGKTDHFEGLIFELTKTEAADFKIDGVLVKIGNTSSKAVHLLKFDIKLEDNPVKVIFTDGWLVPNPEADKSKPPCVNYWTRERFIRGGAHVHVKATTALDSQEDADGMPGPMCATLCYDEADCLQSSVLLDSSNEDVTNAFSILEEIYEDSDPKEFTIVRLALATKDAAPWHINGIEAKVLPRYGSRKPQTLQMLADHWVTHKDARPERPCAINWGVGPLFLREGFRRLALRLKPRVSSPPVDGPVCVYLCSDRDGDKCADTWVSVTNLFPGQDRVAYSVLWKDEKPPLSIRMEGPAEDNPLFVASVGVEVPFKKEFLTRGWLLPGKDKNGLEKDLLGNSCWNWKGKEHTLLQPTGRIVANALTKLGPGRTFTHPGHFCAQPCIEEGKCLTSKVDLSSLVPGQWASFDDIVEDQDLPKSYKMGGVQLDARTSNEWFCDKIQIGVQASLGGLQLPSAFSEFSIIKWLDKPVETKEYPLRPATASIFVKLGPTMRVVATTKRVGGVEAGSTGPIRVYLCQAKDDCMSHFVTMTNLIQNQEQVFSEPAYDFPKDFKLRGIRIASETTDAWFGRKIRVEFLKQRVDFDLDGWFVSKINSGKIYAGNPRFVLVQKFMAPSIRAHATVYMFGACKGKIGIKPCKAKGACESAITIDGSWSYGQENQGSGDIDSLADPAEFTTNFLKITNDGDEVCKIGWVKFSLAGRTSRMFGPLADGADLVDKGSLGNFEAKYTLAAGASMDMEPAETLTAVASTGGVKNGGCDGAAGVAVCDEDGKKCLNRFVFVGGMRGGGQTTVLAPVPLKKIMKKYPEWKPAGIFVEALSDNDAWMLSEVTVESTELEAPIIVFAGGWLAKQKADSKNWVGNFWEKSEFLRGGGAKLKVEAVSLVGAKAASPGPVELEACDLSGSPCIGPVRLTQLHAGPPEAVFVKGIGKVPKDLTQLGELKIKAETDDAWCVKEIKVTLLPVGMYQIPATTDGSAKVFAADGCVSTKEGVPGVVDPKQPPVSFFEKDVTLKFGARATVTVMTREDSGALDEELGPVYVRFCTSSSNCVGNATLKGLKPGKNATFETMITELRKDKAATFKLDGIFIQFDGKHGAWHPEWIKVKLEDEQEQIFRTDGWFTRDSKLKRPPCAHYWSRMRYVRRGTIVRFIVRTSEVSSTGAPAGPICASPCQAKDTNCLDAHPVLLGGQTGSALSPGSVTVHESIIENELFDSTDIEKYGTAKLEAADKSSVPWHVEKIEMEFDLKPFDDDVIEEGRFTQSTKIFADHWVSPDASNPEPCANGWGVSPLFLSTGTKRVRLKVKARQVSNTVRGPICVSLCRDPEGLACAADRISVASLLPGHEVVAEGLMPGAVAEPVSLKLEGSSDIADGALYAESFRFETPWTPNFLTNGWLMPKGDRAVKRLNETIDKSCANWVSHTHVLAPTSNYIVVQAVTPSSPASAGSPGPFCLRPCRSDGRCLKSAVLLDDLFPGQEVAYRSVIDDRDVLADDFELGGVKIEAHTDVEWYCDRVKVGIAGGPKESPDLIQFPVQKWLDRPLEKRAYLRGAPAAKATFVTLAGPVLTVKATTRSDAKGAGTLGRVAVSACASEDDCLETSVVMESLEAGQTQNFEAPMGSVPSGFSLKGVFVQALSDDAWFADGLRVTLQVPGKPDQTLNTDLDGWFVDKVPLDTQFDGNPSFVSSSRLVAPTRTATAKIYTFGECVGPLLVAPCTAQGFCEKDAVSVNGPFVVGEDKSGSGVIGTIFDPQAFDAKFLRISNAGKDTCKVAWVEFELQGKFTRRYGLPSAHARLVPAKELDFTNLAYMASPGKYLDFEWLTDVLFDFETPGQKNSAARGPFAAALCDSTGSKCLTHLAFPGDMRRETITTIIAPMPIALALERDPDWSPYGVYITALEGSDPWMCESIKVRGKHLTAFEIFVRGWFASRRPQSVAWAGNFWVKEQLLVAGGAKLKITALSMDEAVGPNAAFNVRACSARGACIGPVRLTKLHAGAPESVFFAAVGVPPANFRKLATLEVATAGNDTWCVDTIKAQLEPVGSYAIPSYVDSSQKGFKGNGCLTPLTSEAALQAIQDSFTSPLAFVSTSASLGEGGEAVRIETFTEDMPFSESKGNFELSLCIGEKRCEGPLTLYDLKKGLQQFDLQMPNDIEGDFLPTGIKILALTDDSWYVGWIKVVMRGVTQDYVMNGWFEKYPNQERHMGRYAGKFVTDEQYFPSGPVIEVFTTTAAGTAGSIGPFDIILCSDADTCFEDTPITLTHLQAGMAQHFKGNMPFLLGNPDFQPAGLLVKARTTDAWGPMQIKVKIGTTETPIDVNGYFDSQPRPLRSYPGSPLFASDALYIDECTSFGCTQMCEIKTLWTNNQRSQVPQCSCNGLDRLNADGKKCDPPPKIHTFVNGADQCVVSTASRKRCGPATTIPMADLETKAWQKYKDTCDKMRCCFEATREFRGCYHPDISKSFLQKGGIAGGAFLALETLLTQPMHALTTEDIELRRRQYWANAPRYGRDEAARHLEAGTVPQLLHTMQTEWRHSEHHREALEHIWQQRHRVQRGNSTKTRHGRASLLKTWTDPVSTKIKKTETPGCGATCDPPPSIDYLGMSYDHISGDPWGDPVLSVDPGFRHPFVSLDFGIDRTMVDSLYQSPKQGWVAPVYACFRSASAQLISDRKSLQESGGSVKFNSEDISFGIKASFENSFFSIEGGAGASFSSSNTGRSENNKERNEMQEMSEYVTVATCTEYTASLSPFIPWKMDQDAQDALIAIFKEANAVQECNICRGFTELESVPTDAANPDGKTLSRKKCSDTIDQTFGNCWCVRGSDGSSESDANLELVYRRSVSTDWGWYKRKLGSTIPAGSTSPSFVWEALSASVGRPGHQANTCTGICGGPSLFDPTSTCKSYQKWHKFFEVYGTQVVTGLDMGARARESVLSFDKDVEEVATVSTDVETDFNRVIYAEVGINGADPGTECDAMEGCDDDVEAYKEQLRDERRERYNEKKSAKDAAEKAESDRQRDAFKKRSKSDQNLGRRRRRKQSSRRRRRKNRAGKGSFLSESDSPGFYSNASVYLAGLSETERADAEAEEACWSSHESNQPSFALDAQWNHNEATHDFSEETGMKAGMSSVSQTEATHVGGLPAGEDWPAWAESIQSRPMPIKYTTTSMELLIEGMLSAKMFEIKEQEGLANTADFAKVVEEQLSVFKDNMKKGIESFAALTGVPIPDSCQYDTIGNIKKWGNGGKRCKPRCRLEVYQDNTKGERPASFAPGVWRHLKDSKKEEIVALAASQADIKKVEINKACVGFMIEGKTEQGDPATEEYFIDHAQGTSGLVTKTAAVKQIETVTLMAHPLAMPTGAVRFKLRKAPRGFETCVGIGPSKTTIQASVDAWFNTNAGQTAWYKNMNEADAAYKKEDDPCFEYGTIKQGTQRDLCKLQLDETRDVWKEKTMQRLMTIWSKKGTTPKVEAQSLLGDLKQVCKYCANKVNALAASSNFDTAVGGWYQSLSSGSAQGLSLVECRSTSANWQWKGRKVVGGEGTSCLGHENGVGLKVKNCMSTPEVQLYQDGYHWAWDGAHLRMVTSSTRHPTAPTYCIGSENGQCNAGNPMELKSCDAIDTVLIMQEQTAEGCEPPKLREKIAKMVAEVTGDTDQKNEIVFYSEKKTWGDAKKYCNEMGMFLATVCSDADRQLLSQISHGHSWIGGRFDRSRTMSWDEGESEMSENVRKECKLVAAGKTFSSGEPNNHGGNQYCVQTYGPDNGMALDDLDCNARRTFSCSKRG